MESHDCTRLFGMIVCIDDKIVVYETKAGKNEGIVVSIDETGIVLDNAGVSVAISYKRISKVVLLNRGKVYHERMEMERKRAEEIRRLVLGSNSTSGENAANDGK